MENKMATEFSRNCFKEAEKMMQYLKKIGYDPREYQKIRNLIERAKRLTK